MQSGYEPSAAGERWNVNLPAVIGVVFVFLVGVVVWVIATAGDDDGDGVASPPSATTAADPPATSGASTEPPGTPATTGTTSPAPMPSTSLEASTTAPSTAPPTSEPATPSTPPTTAPGAVDGAVPGDLGVPGVAMQQPPCDGGYITVLASPIGDQANAASVASVLEDYPGSNYLRTDQTCPSLTQDVDGEPIYVIFFGPFAFDSDACTARADGPDGAYARRLSTELGPDHSVACT